MAERRRFIATAGGVMAAAAAAAIVGAPNVIAQPKIQWRMSTASPPTLDVQQGAAQRLAAIVEEMSGGRFRIEVFAAGQIMPAFDCFDAASQGRIEMFSAASIFWDAKDPAFQWFTTIPFGMNPAGMAAWFYQGDGLKLWEETYLPFNLVPRPGLPSAPEMGGWFRKKVTTIACAHGSYGSYAERPIRGDYVTVSAPPARAASVPASPHTVHAAYAPRLDLGGPHAPGVFG